jgi:hypothetical protein
MFCFEKPRYVAILTGLMLVASGHAMATTYKLTVLGSDRETLLVPTAINAAGTVAGYIGKPDPFRSEPVRVTDGKFRRLHGPVDEQQNVEGEAWAINDAGHIVGGYTNEFGSGRPFIAVEGLITELARPPEGYPFYATGINNQGLVVGNANAFFSRGTTAYSVDAGGTVTRLPVPAGYSYTSASAVNNHGVIVGEAIGGTIFYRTGDALRWVDGVLQALVGLGGGSSAQAINDGGTIVGCAELPGKQVGHAVVFLKLGDGALDLHGTATGSSCAYGINEAGVVVGQRSDTVNSEYVQRAVVYFPEVGVMQDLQDLLVRSQRGQWVLTTAVAINVDGKIIGRGHRLDDPTRLQAVLLTPVR